MTDHQAAGTAMKAWLGRDTVLSGHPNDEERFYDFVAAVWREKPSLWNEAAIRKEIAKTGCDLHPDWPRESIEKLATEMEPKGTTILDFLCHLKSAGAIAGLAE